MKVNYSSIGLYFLLVFFSQIQFGVKAQNVSFRFYNGLYNSEPFFSALDSKGNLYVTSGMSIVKVTGQNSSVPVLTNKTKGFDSLFNAKLDNEPRYSGFVFSNLDTVIYVSDARRGNILKYYPAKDTLVLLAGGLTVGGYANGKGRSARFEDPKDITIDRKTGDLYVLDTRYHNIRKITPDGTVSTYAGRTDGQDVQGYVDGAASSARFAFRADNEMSYGGICFSRTGDSLLVADADNKAIRYISNGQVGTIFKASVNPGFRNGTDTNARAYRFVDLEVLKDGSIAVIDVTQRTSIVRKVKGNRITGFCGSYDLVDPLDPTEKEGVGLLAGFRKSQSILASPSRDSLFLNSDRNMRVLTRITPSVSLTLPSKAAVGDSLFLTSKGLKLSKPAVDSILPFTPKLSGVAVSLVKKSFPDSSYVKFTTNGTVTITIETSETDTYYASSVSGNIAVGGLVTGESDQYSSSTSVFPNPFQYSFTVLSKNEGDVLSLSEVNGKLVSTGVVKNGKAEFQVPGLMEGVYFLKSSKDGSVVRMLRY